MAGTFCAAGDGELTPEQVAVNNEQGGGFPSAEKTGITRTKDVNTVIHPDDGRDEGTDGLATQLTARDLMDFGIAIVIGNAIFVLTGVEAKNHAYRAQHGAAVQDPKVPLLPIISAVTCLGPMSNLTVETWLRFLVWLVVGLVIYFSYGRTHARLAPERESEVADELRADEVV